MNNLGVELGQNGTLSAEFIKSFYKMEDLSATFRFIFRVVRKIGLTDWFWNKQLKKNDVFDNRYAKPLEDLINK